MYQRTSKIHLFKVLGKKVSQRPQYQALNELKHDDAKTQKEKNEMDHSSRLAPQIQRSSLAMAETLHVA